MEEKLHNDIKILIEELEEMKDNDFLFKEIEKNSDSLLNTMNIANDDIRDLMSKDFITTLFLMNLLELKKVGLIKIINN